MTASRKRLDDCLFEQLMKENSDAEAFTYLALVVSCLSRLLNRRKSEEAGRILLR